ncbi:MAG: MarR family transcriptional regulator [Chloroflexi bacterium]|nr:MarR family transcriptional regulator [Chloroflexota bacterium]
MNPDKARDFASRVLHLISELVKNNEMCDRECVAQFGVTASQGYTILSLPAEGTLSMNELSKAMSVDNSTMTRMVDQLVDKGLVYRKPDEKDRRLVRIGLTEKGKELHRDLEAELENFYQAALDGISEEERLGIIHSLEQLNNAIKAAIETCGTVCAAGKAAKVSRAERA